MIKVTRIPVDSSMISAVGYDEESQILFAEFAKTGKIYAYEEVEKEVFEELLEESSIGSYFRGCIIGCYADWEATRNVDIKW